MWVSPSPPGERAGEGLCPPQKIFGFGSQYDEFWCILDGIFYSSDTCFTRKTGVIWCPSPYFLLFRFKKDLVHFLAFWRRQKFHAAGPVLVRPSECITLHLGLIARRLRRFSIVHRFLLKLRLTSCAGIHLDIAK